MAIESAYLLFSEGNCTRILSCPLYYSAILQFYLEVFLLMMIMMNNGCNKSTQTGLQDINV